MPETKGKTLEEMDELFGAAGFAAADAQLKADIERRIGLSALLGEDDGHEVLGYEKGKGDQNEELVEKKDLSE